METQDAQEKRQSSEKVWALSCHRGSNLQVSGWVDNEEGEKKKARPSKCQLTRDERKESWSRTDLWCLCVIPL